ncbi:MAG: hypothetical protein ABL964_14590 [Steroidobacteraceae bacterium]
MRSPALRAALLLFVASLGAGCALFEAGDKRDSSDTPSAIQKKPLELSRQRLELSEGYSKLYAAARKIDLTDLVLYIKSSPPNVDAIIKDAAEFGDELKKDLERIARDYPGVRIDIVVLPEIEKRARVALAKDLAQQFAPVVGKGGREYERTVLIGYAVALEHERYLSRVMAEEEPDPGLKKFLLATEKRYNSLFDRVMALLDKDYFRNQG